MSKKDKDDKGATQKPVALPSYPKYDNNKRDAWANEYDKVESELLKSHLQQPNASTTTLGLRLLPNNFDRTIPTMEVESSATERPQKSVPRSRTTDPDESRSTFGRLSPIFTNSPGRSIRRRPISAKTPHNVVSTLPAAAGKCETAPQCAQTLLTLLRPSLQFKTSFNIDTTGVNISWLHSITANEQPPTLTTLETVREDMLVNPSATGRGEGALSSPRSVVVILRNGLSVKDLQFRPATEFQGPGISEESSTAAHKHFEQRRKATLSALRDEYRDYCGQVSLQSILDAVIHIRSGDQDQPSTLIQRSKEKQKMAAQINKEKLSKQMEYIDETRRRLAEAEIRRLKNEDEAKVRQQERRDASRSRLDQTAKRMEELREGTARLNMEFLSKVEKRKAALEEKERQRAEQLRLKKERTKKEQEQKARHREAKIQAKRAAADQARLDQEASFAQKEAAAEERRHLLETEKHANKTKLQEQLRIAEERRQEAREKAKVQQEKERIAAEEKRRAADEKLHQYFKHRDEQREAQNRLEKQKEHERLRKREQAEQLAAERRSQVLAKLAAHEELLYEGRLSKALSDYEHKEQQQFAQDDKAFYVSRKSKAMEFAKLLSVSDISRKKQKAESIAQQRAQLLQATMAEREAARLQQERFKEQMQSKLHSTL